MVGQNVCNLTRVIHVWRKLCCLWVQLKNAGLHSCRTAFLPDLHLTPHANNWWLMFFVCVRCLKLFILLEYKGILNPSSHSTFRKNKNKKCFYCLVNKNKLLFPNPVKPELQQTCMTVTDINAWIEFIHSRNKLSF